MGRLSLSPRCALSDLVRQPRLSPASLGHSSRGEGVRAAAGLMWKDDGGGP